MLNNKSFKGLVVASAVAAMFSSLTVYAQTTAASSASSPTGSNVASTSTAGKLSGGDQKALKDMAQANINEVAAGKIAVDDHGQALTKVQAVAQQKGVTLPTEPDSAHKAMGAKLEKLSGEAFDKAYMQNGGVKDHTAVHKKLMSDVKKIKDADVKALAAEHMPVVEQHLKSAKEMVSASVSSAK
jgi:putative membrane protein